MAVQASMMGPGMVVAQPMMHPQGGSGGGAGGQMEGGMVHGGMPPISPAHMHGMPPGAAMAMARPAMDMGQQGMAAGAAGGPPPGEARLPLRALPHCP
jgi:hypothetical protein